MNDTTHSIATDGQSLGPDRLNTRLRGDATGLDAVLARVGEFHDSEHCHRESRRRSTDSRCVQKLKMTLILAGE